MSKYLTTGWENLNFLITPQELAEMLKDMHLLVVNSHVPDGYEETSLEEYLADYSALYGKLASGQETFYPAYSEIGVAGTLETHSYGYPHIFEGKPYLQKNFDEPCAIIGYIPLYVYKKENGSKHYSLAYSLSQFSHEIVGLRLFFPKWIQYPCDGGYTQLQTTKELASYQDYLTIREQIKSITKPLRFMLDDRVVRPNICVSTQARKAMENFRVLTKSGIRVI